MRKHPGLLLVASMAAALALAGCKGDPSTDQPAGKTASSDTGGSLKDEKTNGALGS